MSELVLPHTIDGGTEITAIEHQDNYVAIRNLINGNLEGGSGAAGNLKADGVGARELANALLVKGLPVLGDVNEGVMSAGGLLVTPGAGLQLNFAAGSAWVIDDSGLVAVGALLPATIAGSTVTIAANASGDPRIDQVILTLTGHNTGTVSVLQGTATAGATLANLTGAAALPNDAIRFAYVLMPNAFAGPFVAATHLSDTRTQALAAAGGRKSVIATEETRTNVAYGLMTTPDVVTGVVVPADATVRIGYQAMWKEAVNAQAMAAIFIGANQLKISQHNVAAPVLQEAMVAGQTNDTYTPLTSGGHGLTGNNAVAPTAYTGDVTTGQVLGIGNAGASSDNPFSAVGSHGYGFCEVFVAAGTYDISIQFKVASNSVTVKNRTLRVEVVKFA